MATDELHSFRDAPSVTGCAGPNIDLDWSGPPQDPAVKRHSCHDSRIFFLKSKGRKSAQRALFIPVSIPLFQISNFTSMRPTRAFPDLQYYPHIDKEQQRSFVNR